MTTDDALDCVKKALANWRGAIFVRDEADIPEYAADGGNAGAEILHMERFRDGTGVLRVRVAGLGWWLFLTCNIDFVEKRL